MPPSSVTVHAHPTLRHLIKARLRIYLGTFGGLQLTLGGIIGPPVLWLIFRVVTGQPWPASNNVVLVAAPAVSIAILAMVCLSGLKHPQTKVYLRDGARYVLDDSGVSMEGALGSAVLRWEAFTGSIELGDQFVVKQSHAIHLLPKADLAPGCEAELRDLLRRRLGKNART